MTNFVSVKRLVFIIGVLVLVKWSNGDKDQTSPGHIPIYSPWTRHLGLWNETRSELIKLMKINRYLYPRILKNSTGISHSDMNDEPFKNSKQSSLWERTYRIPPFPEHIPEGLEHPRTFYDDWYGTSKQKSERERTETYLRGLIKANQESYNEVTGNGIGNRIIKKSDKSSSTSVVAAVIIFMGILSMIVRIAGRSKSNDAPSESRTEGNAEHPETNEFRACHIISRRPGPESACHSSDPDADCNSDSSNEHEPISLVSCYPPTSILLHNNRTRINGSTIVIIRRKSDYSDPPPPYPGYPSNLPQATNDTDAPPPYPGVRV